jgi:hypothetical protein
MTSWDLNGGHVSETGGRRAERPLLWYGLATAPLGVRRLSRSHWRSAQPAEDVSRAEAAVAFVRR